MNKYSGRLYNTTMFNHGGRKAGMGIVEDNYDDESSGRGECRRREKVRFPHDDIDPDELHGPVIIVQAARK